jgi:hypothetical protein
MDFTPQSLMDFAQQSQGVRRARATYPHTSIRAAEHAPAEGGEYELGNEAAEEATLPSAGLRRPAGLKTRTKAAKCRLF